MLKGAQKQMIVVRTRDSRVFEEAHFVIRRGADRQGVDELDLLWEANRIIENSLPRSEQETSSVRHSFSERSEKTDRATSKASVGRAAAEFRFPLVAGLFWYSLGFLCGAALVGLLWLLL